jgi:hypothetical protein
MNNTEGPPIEPNLSPEPREVICAGSLNEILGHVAARQLVDGWKNERELLEDRLYRKYGSKIYPSSNTPLGTRN